MLRLSVVSPNATYQLTPTVASINEGEVLIVNLTTTGVQLNQKIQYTLSGPGITQADFVGVSPDLTGEFTVVNGFASVTIPIASDVLLEGNETLTITLKNLEQTSATVTVNDTSVPVVVLDVINYPHPTMSTGRLIPQWGTPTVTSITSASWNGYTATTSDSYSNQTYWASFRPFILNDAGWALFEGGNGFGWLSSHSSMAAQGTTRWIQIDCPTPLTPTGFYFSYGGEQWGSVCYMSNFMLQGSNNGTDWITLRTVNGHNPAGHNHSDESKVLLFTITNVGTYTKFRLSYTHTDAGIGYSPIIEDFGLV